MNSPEDPRIKLINRAIGAGRQWGLSLQEIAVMLGCEMPGGDDKTVSSINITSSNIQPVSERAFTVVQLKAALSVGWSDTTQRKEVEQSRTQFDGKSVRDLLISGNREDLARALDFCMYRFGR